MTQLERVFEEGGQSRAKGATTASSQSPATKHLGIGGNTSFPYPRECLIFHSDIFRQDYGFTIHRNVLTNASTDRITACSLQCNSPHESRPMHVLKNLVPPLSGTAKGDTIHNTFLVTLFHTCATALNVISINMCSNEKCYNIFFIYETFVTNIFK